MTTSATENSVVGVLEKVSDGISVKEAAERIGVTQMTIRNWIKQGKLPNTTIFGGSITRIDPADLENLRRPA